MLVVDDDDNFYGGDTISWCWLLDFGRSFMMIAWLRPIQAHFYAYYWVRIEKENSGLMEISSKVGLLSCYKLPTRLWLALKLLPCLHICQSKLWLAWLLARCSLFKDILIKDINWWQIAENIWKRGAKLKERHKKNTIWDGGSTAP